MAPFDGPPAAVALDTLRQAQGERFLDSAARLAGLAGTLLGWRPDEFWRATPEELGGVLAALAGGEAGEMPPDAAMMAQLMERFPDG
jgi:uncharacterized phage protein (TIGR02216 family)